ncbi:MAG TPA: hypothetical protein VMV81_09750, partial [Phycisphaerae bacterium]|nr:hypothetical protein [Phycisphaerae bacterium]
MTRERALVLVLLLLQLVPCSTSATDCNNNGIPDDCDISCGATGGPCDIPGCGTKSDCNNNGLPDDCDVSAGNFALHFDGANDLLTLPNSLVQGRTQLTFEAWFKTAGSGV